MLIRRMERAELVSVAFLSLPLTIGILILFSALQDSAHSNASTETRLDFGCTSSLVGQSGIIRQWHYCAHLRNAHLKETSFFYYTPLIIDRTRDPDFGAKSMSSFFLSKRQNGHIGSSVP